MIAPKWIALTLLLAVTTAAIDVVRALTAAAPPDARISWGAPAHGRR